MFSRSILSFALVASAIPFGAAQDSVDIGGPSIPGTSNETAPGSWDVSGSGHDIWGTRDGFHFLYYNRTTDCTLTLYVENFDENNFWAKAGLMVRDSLDDNAAHGAIFVNGGSDTDYYTAMQSRPDTGGSSNSHHPSIGLTSHNVWLRLTKEGNTVTSYVKKDGELTYSKYMTRTVNFSGGQFHAGIPVASHNNGYLATLSVSNFEISDEVFSLPSKDIGDVGREVEAQETADGAWSIKGAGTGIGDTADGFAYLNYKQSGNHSFSVQIGKFEPRNINSKGGLMLRASHAVDAPHVSLLTTRKNGITLFYRATAGGNTTSKNVGVWDHDLDLKLEKTGNSVSCFYKHKSNPDYFHIGTVSIDLDPVYRVGVAVDSAEYGQHATLYAGNVLADNQVMVPAIE